jgi:hypothetical protein
LKQLTAYFQGDVIDMSEGDAAPAAAAAAEEEDDEEVLDATYCI